MTDDIIEKTITGDDAKAAFKKRTYDANKGDFGYITLLGGCERYSGALRLAWLANAAMRSGCGVCRAAIPRNLISLVAPNILESTVFPLSEKDGGIRFVKSEIDELILKSKAIAFGMGIGLSEEIPPMLKYVIENYDKALLIDADGLTALAGLLKDDRNILKRAKCRIVLTPHLKEFSRLCGATVETIKNDRRNLALRFAKENGVVLLLKGPPTLVTDGNTVNLIEAGCPGMATAGSGDVLSGILAALMGYNDDMVIAASAAAYINGKAGELACEKYGEVSMISSDTALEIAEVIKALTK